jgi:plasmid stability protein
MSGRTLNDVRIRNLDPNVAAALERLAESDGRTVEAYLRELIKDAVRTRIRDFPTASEWDRVGVGKVQELQPGRQYLARVGDRDFRITLARAVTGEQPEWNAEIEEPRTIRVRGDTIQVWARGADAPRRTLGDTPAMVLREAMRLIAERAGVNAPSRSGAGARDVSPAFGAIIDELDAHIPFREKAYPRDKMVIYHTGHFDVYLNEIDAKHGALMVYRSGENWSITNGRADYFPLNDTAVTKITKRLRELHVVSGAAQEQL